MSKSLYEEIGGEEAIVAAVDLFYQKVIADEELAPFFNGLSMNQQSSKMVGFMAWAFGGPSEYKGRDLTSAHSHLIKEKGLHAGHFDKVADHLKLTLAELGLSDDLINQSLAIVGSTKSQVFGA
tara:strand:+ start:882 stop:1253 length:372 start_codon:yes stop_codon:yes gene_type:complete